MKSFRFYIPLLSLLLFSACAEERKPEEILADFIEASNSGKDLSEFGNSKSIAKDYLKSRKFAEKINATKIDCETTEEKAICDCETESGKKRKFTLVKNDSGWEIDFNAPEIILELFHINSIIGNFKTAKKYATVIEKDRLKSFEAFVEYNEAEADKLVVVPFEFKCKEFKKKLDCACTSEEGLTTYTLFKTSKGWKAELGSQSDAFVSDTIIDYNSSEDFNLNQHDLDSLTDFSQKMLDSMLSL